MKRTFLQIGLKAINVGNLKLAEEALGFIEKRIKKNLNNSKQRKIWVEQYKLLKEAIDKAKSN